MSSVWASEVLPRKINGKCQKPPTDHEESEEVHSPPDFPFHRLERGSTPNFEVVVFIKLFSLGSPRRLVSVRAIIKIFTVESL